MGHLRVDRGPQHLVRHRDAHDARHRRLGRPARRQEARAGHDDHGLRARHGGSGAHAGLRGRPDGRCARDGAGDRLQRVLFLRRVADRRLPARAGNGRGHGQGERLGLGLRLCRRHAGAGAVPGVRAVVAGAGAAGGALRAGHDADHGGDLRRGRLCHLRAAARTRRAAGPPRPGQRLAAIARHLPAGARLP
ncbi:hypothetical protein D3C71_1044550 [compost metagenome]